MVFGEAVLGRGMPEPCQFPSLDSCQTGFLWTFKEAALALHAIVGFVLHIGDAEKFSHALGLESLDPFLRVSRLGPCFTVIEEGGRDNRLVQL